MSKLELILSEVRRLAATRKTNEERLALQHHIMIGVVLALGDECPPTWRTHVRDGRTDAIPQLCHIPLEPIGGLRC